jgi:2-amino-4-hydroxy-6-hydroxymethyldihydropteridine diphosphokinase
MLPLKQVETAYLALGSNLGNRLEHLANAYARVKADPLITSVKASSVYETRAVGLSDAPDFLNAVLEIKTQHVPQSLLNLGLAIEKEFGRVRTFQLASRTLDIDLLIYAQVRLATESLILPHTRLTQRAFVLMPLCELSKHLIVDAKEVSVWLSQCDTTGVKRLDITFTDF